MDQLRLAFGFLMFHRRIILGILLLVGLYFFITKLVPELSKAKRNANDRVPSSPAEDRNSAEARVETKAQPDESADQLLASSDTDKLLAEMMRLKGLVQASAKDDGKALVLLADVVKIAKRILDLPLSLEQRKYVLKDLADSTLAMRLINIDSTVANETIDAEFLTKTRELLKDRDPEIASLAALMIVSSAMYECHSKPSEENLLQLESAINDQFDNIRTTPNQLRNLASFLVLTDLATTSLIDTQPFFDRLIQRFAEDENPEIQELGRLLKENWVFKKLDVENLVFRMGDRRPESDLMVDRFFETLEKFPNASLLIYQISMEVIREYLIQERPERALEMAEFLESRVLVNRKDDDMKPQIQRALNELKEIGLKSKR